MKQMTRRIFGLLLTAAVLLGTVSPSALAASTGMARIGDQSYGSFKAALDHAETGDTIVLLQDSDCRNQELCVEKWQQDVTLDLNGHELIVTQFIVQGDLTVRDSTAQAQPTLSGPDLQVEYAGGKITDRPNESNIGYVTVAINEDGILTLESGTIESTFNCAVHVEGERMSALAGPGETRIIVNGGYIKAPGYAVGLNGVGAAAEIHGGVVESTNYAAISGSGDDRDGSYGGGTRISMDGGTVIGRVSPEDREADYHACGIFHPQEGVVELSGGLVCAVDGVGVQMCGGTLSMTGGTVMTTGNFAGQRCDATPDQPIPQENCFGIQLDQEYGYYDGDNVKAAITGGTVVTEAGVPALDLRVDEEDQTPDRLVVTGGTFSNDVSRFLPEGVSGQTDANGDFQVGGTTDPDPIPQPQGAERSISAGTSALHSPLPMTDGQGTYYQPASYVYLGGKDENAIRWRVLDAERNSMGTAGLFLLTNGLYGETELGGVRFDSAAPYSAQWAGSEAQLWCQSFLGSAFQEAERAALQPTTKVEEGLRAFEYDWAGSQLQDEPLFFLSVDELMACVADHSKAPGMAALRADGGTSGNGWWLRTPLDNRMFIASGVLTAAGKAEYSHVNATQYAARPACNLDPAKVLFTSAARGGKAGTLGELRRVEDYTGQDWKLTLVDESRADFRAALSGTTLTYSGARTGENEYISAVLVNDQGEIAAYGRLAPVKAASGTVELSSALLGQEGLSLRFFNEQYNGGTSDTNGRPDLASPLSLGGDSTDPGGPDVDPDQPDLPPAGAQLQLMAGTTGLHSPSDTGTGHLPESYLWYGIHHFTDKNTDYAQPVLWRVLDAEENIAGASGLLLLTERTLGAGFNGDVVFGEGYVSPWAGSQAQTWCRSFAEETLTGTERAALQTVSKQEADGTAYGKNWAGQDLSEEQVFFLSAFETARYLSAQQRDESLRTQREAPGRSSSYWWLRSPETGDWGMGNANVNKDGDVAATAAGEKRVARPALDLDPARILFTSAAEGGKSPEVGALAPLQTYEGNEWKLTLLDSARSGFEVRYAEGTLHYAGAMTGENEYLSAVLVEDATGAVTHYGKLAQITGASGTLPFALPEDMEGKTLYFFNEQDNGDQKTDYASALVACVPQHTHSGVLVPGTPAACETDGTRDYYLCDCGLAFEDAACTREIVDLGRWVVIPALGHDWGEPVYTWSQDGGRCTAQRTCRRDPAHTGTAEAVVTREGNTCTAVFAVEWAECQTLELETGAGSGGPARPVKKPRPQETVPFVDVEKDAYYYEAVKWAGEQGIASGVDPTHFAPDAPCTRAQVVTFLWAAAGRPQQTSDVKAFLDVQEGEWYEEAVLWAVEQGVAVGISDTEFAPDRTCTRAEAMTLLWRYSGRPAAGTGGSFTDVAEADWFSEAVRWALSEGITVGVGQGTFGAEHLCTRAQIVTFLYRMGNQ